MLMAVPPSMVPMLAVVSSSRRPRRIAATASLAIRIALIPFSGQTPAWASRPRTVNCSRLAAGAGVELRHIQMPRPQESDLFADGEHDLQLSVGDRFFSKDPKDLADDGDAALVIRPQDRGSVAADDVPLDPRLDPDVGADGVHVGAEQEGGRPRSGSADAGDEVSARSPDQPIGLVKAHLGPEVVEFLREVHRQRSPLGGGAVDPYQRDEMVSHPLAMDHRSPPLSGSCGP